MHLVQDIDRAFWLFNTSSDHDLVMSSATSTTYTATTAGPVENTVQSGHSKTSSRRDSTVTKVTTTAPRTPTPQQPPTSTTAVPTPPTSRPSTPFTPTGTPSSLPSSPVKPEIKSSARSKWLNHLSHISIATWIGVGLALGGLVVTIYYGIPIMRLAVWTAQNDFREACKSELEIGLQQSAACNRTLAQPAQPPPIMKRTISDFEDKYISRELAPWVAATCFAFLLAFCSGVRGSTVTQPNFPERSVSTGKTSQNVTAIESLSLEQLMQAVFDRSESHTQAMFSLLEIYLARETFGPASEPTGLLRDYLEALITLVARRCPSIETNPRAMMDRESRESGPQESELSESESTANPLSHNPPTPYAEPPNATTQDGTETETSQAPAGTKTASALTLAAPSPTATTTADSKTRADTASLSTRADSSTKRWKAIPEMITKAIAQAIAAASPQPKFLTTVHFKKPRGLNRFGRMSRDLFEKSQGLFYLLALMLGGYWTSLLVLTPHGRVALSVQLATTVGCFCASRSLHGCGAARTYDRALDVSVNRLLLFSVYTCLRRIWPSDTLTYKVFTWALGTVLCTWMFAVYCVVHETEQMRRPGGSNQFLRW